jgi:predicted acetyltransferase
MQDYLAELSRYGEVNAAYPHFDAYWSEDDRWPYLIEVDDHGRPLIRARILPLQNSTFFPTFVMRGLVVVLVMG